MDIHLTACQAKIRPQEKGRSIKVLTESGAEQTQSIPGIRWLDINVNLKFTTSGSDAAITEADIQRLIMEKVSKITIKRAAERPTDQGSGHKHL